MVLAPDTVTKPPPLLSEQPEQGNRFSRSILLFMLLLFVLETAPLTGAGIRPQSMNMAKRFATGVASLHFACARSVGACDKRCADPLLATFSGAAASPSHRCRNFRRMQTMHPEMRTVRQVTFTQTGKLHTGTSFLGRGPAPDPTHDASVHWSWRKCSTVRGSPEKV